MVAVPSDTSDYAFLSSGTWSLLGLELDELIITEKREMMTKVMTKVMISTDNRKMMIKVMITTDNREMMTKVIISTGKRKMITNENMTIDNCEMMTNVIMN